MEENKLFKQLDNLFIASLAALLFSGVTVYYLTRNSFRLNLGGSTEELRLLPVAIVSAAIFIVKYFEKKLRVAYDSREKKLSAFKKLTFIRVLSITVSNLIALLAFNASYDYAVLLIYAIMIALLFAYRPLPAKFKKEFESFFAD